LAAGGGEMKKAEKEALLKQFNHWFLKKDVNNTEEELLKYYGGKSFGWNFFIAYCAGYLSGKKASQ
jgi:hypothetical protein